MFKVIVFIGMVTFLGITLCFAQGEEDSITITTYYPSPYGVYKTLRLYPGSKAASCNTGEITYDDGFGSDPAGYYFCDDGGNWQPSGGTGGYWTLDDVNNYLYTNNNWNVGIGTTTPQSKLQVTDMITVGEESTIDGEIQLEDSGGKTYDAGIRTDSSANLILRSHATGAEIQFETGNPESTRMVISEGGDVGIGTTSPGYKLDVAGQVNATDVCIGGDCRNNWPAGGGTLSVDVNKCTDSDNYSASCTVYCDDATWTRVGCGGYGCQEPSGIKGYGSEPYGSGCRCYVYGRSLVENASVRCHAICVKIQ
jgi:hypothetical protein